ncbi:T9SS type A sorting domain-containing protein, partial [Candidatus Woesearchaeota archaeon]|nr:T9SS type A sorting domain-containing protein [Candidatus Woesearchaeota archaeon]
DPEDKHDLEYRLDFGNGAFTPWSRTKTYTRPFNPGRYNVVLEVRDSGGLTDRITKELIVNPRLPGDFNNDDKVDYDDFFVFAEHFGSSNAAYDLNADGVVDFTDFFLFADNFGQEARAKLMDLAHQYLGLPREFSLAHNYPNPFNNETAINYALPTDSPVLLEIYNIKGQKVRTLHQGYMPAGSYTAKWDGRDNYGNAVGSGVYFYQLNAGSFSKANKMVMVK